MSVSGLFSTSYADPSSLQQLQQEFQQLGKDLQSGNLSAAQSDFVTLQQDLPQSSNTSSSSASSNPIAEAFNQLSQDLQSGNLAAAKQDYTTIQQDLSQDSSQGTGVEGHHHHHHHGGGDESSAASSSSTSSSDSTSSSSTSNPISQLLTELGKDLQSGNLSAAQKAYTSLQQDLQNSSQTGATSSQSMDISISVVSVSISVNA
jgi:outer membrane protein assembly factor BamD (BamD/ComL family)